MLTEQDKQAIIEIGKRYRVGKILLFGSSLHSGSSFRDFDLAVAGITPAQFFSFYADLIFSLPKPVDLVDLDRKSRFTDLILREGVPIYG